MKKEEQSKALSIARRDFIKFGAGAAVGMMSLGAILSALRDDAIVEAQGKGKVEPFWAARPGKAGVGKPISIDCHAHWSPEPYNQALAELGVRIPNAFELDVDLDKRRQWMDTHGVQMHCLSLSGAMPWQRTSPADGAHLAQIINDYGIEVHNRFPDRFVLAAEMPIRDPQLALKELNRVAGKPGVRAVHLPDSIERHDYLVDPGFEPVLARIEELNLPIIFHQFDGEANNYGGNRVSGPPNLAAGLDAPIEHAVIATKLIITGTLDKFPNLQMVLPHAGGVFPYLAGRIEHFLYHMSSPVHVQLKLPFKDYVRRFHYDYLIYYPETFRFLMDFVGTDRIVVGTDSFAAKDIEYPTAVMDQFNLPAKDRDLILQGNARRLLHL